MSSVNVAEGTSSCPFLLSYVSPSDSRDLFFFLVPVSECLNKVFHFEWFIINVQFMLAVQSDFIMENVFHVQDAD